MLIKPIHLHKILELYKAMNAPLKEQLSIFVWQQRTHLFDDDRQR